MSIPKLFEIIQGTRKITRLDMLTPFPILDQSHKGWVLQIEKVPLQISFKHSEPFLAFLVNFCPKTFCFVLKGNLMQEKSQNLSGKQREESMI